LAIELAVLAGGGLKTVARRIRVVRRVAQLILHNAGSQPSVQKAAEALIDLSGESFWVDPQVDQLEKYREAIRDLMKYLPEKGKPATIDAEDEIIDKENPPDFFIDIRTYKEKVIDYILEHSDNATIRKIKNIDPINAADLKELERILWDELGTREDYQKIVPILKKHQLFAVTDEIYAELTYDGNLIISKLASDGSMIQKGLIDTYNSFLGLSISNQPWDIMKETSSASTGIQFSSINTMSVESMELILPIFPSVKYPMGSFLKCSPSFNRISAKTI